MTADRLYEVLNPRGTQTPTQLSPLSPRLQDFKDKKIYLVDLGKPESDTAFDALEQYLTEAIPASKIIRKRKKLTYFVNEPDLWDDIQKNANALVFGVFD
jgi:hypothetical protein